MPRRKKPRPPRVVLLDTSRLADLDGRIERLEQLYDNLMLCRDAMSCNVSDALVILRAVEASNADVRSALDRHTAATLKRRKKTAEPCIPSVPAPVDDGPGF